MATPGMPLLTLEDPATYRLEVQARRSTRGARPDRAQPSRSASTARRVEGDDWLDARVVEIARVDPASHAFLVKLDLPASASWRSGLFGRARFPGPARRALTAPASALVSRGQLTFVYLVDGDQRARLRPISSGVSGDRRHRGPRRPARRRCRRDESPDVADRWRSRHWRTAMKPPTGVCGSARRGVHPLEADAAGHRRLAAARRVCRRRAAPRGRAADHRADGRRVRGHARRLADRSRAARHAPDREAAVGSPGRRVPLLHLEPRPRHGRRPLPRRPGRRARARAPESEARRERDAAAARRLAAARPGALDRRRAGHGAHALGPGYDDVQLRQIGGAAAGDAEGTAGHLRGHDHRRPAAPGDGRSRPGRAGRAQPRSARRAAGARRGRMSRSPSRSTVTGNQATRIETGAWLDVARRGEDRRRRHRRRHAGAPRRRRHGRGRRRRARRLRDALPARAVRPFRR